jgi:hypothetical protein
MAKGKASLTRSRDKITTPKKRMVKTLTAKPGTTVHYATPNLAVVVSRRAGGGGGGGLGATIDVCRCTKTQFKCSTTSAGYTVCKEECIEWECTTVQTALA